MAHAQAFRECLFQLEKQQAIAATYKSRLPQERWDPRRGAVPPSLARGPGPPTSLDKKRQVRDWWPPVLRRLVYKAPFDADDRAVRAAQRDDARLIPLAGIADRVIGDATAIADYIRQCDRSVQCSVLGTMSSGAIRR
jgi:hypothetical protein